MPNQPFDIDEESLVKDINLYESDSVTSNSTDYNTDSEDQSETSDIGMHSVGYDDELSSCERGKKTIDDLRENSSVDTESLTNDPSLLSSYSIDTQGSSPSRESSGDGDEQQQSRCDHHAQQDEYEEDDVFQSHAIQQLRHRRDYSTCTVEENDIQQHGDAHYYSDLDENGLSPSAKHKPMMPFAIKGNPGGLKSSLPRISIQFILMTYAVYYVLTITHTYDSEWRMPSVRNARKLVRKIENRAAQMSSSSIQNTQFTVRLQGGRIDLLRRSIDQHAYCGSVHQIQIDFQPIDSSEDIISASDFPVELLNHASGKVVQMNPSTSNRPQGSNDSVLLLKEGISLSCSDLERGFAEWKVDPVRVVGFFSDHENNLSSTYSLVSDRAIFVHRIYLSTRPALTLKNPVALKECQHLALSAYIATVSSHSPLLLSPSASIQQTSNMQWQPYGRSTESTTDCVAVLQQAAGFQSIPTVPTRFIGQSLLKQARS